MYNPGDVILVRSGNWFGDLILKFTQLCSKDSVRYSHIAIIKDSTSILQSRFEVEEQSLEFELKNWKKYKIIRYKELTSDQANKMINACLKLKGVDYGYVRLILQLLDNIFSTHKFTKLSKNNKDQVCSSLIAWLFYTCTKKTKINDSDWRSCDPDDFEDDFEKNPDKWELILSKD